MNKLRGKTKGVKGQREEELKPETIPLPSHRYEYIKHDR